MAIQTGLFEFAMLASMKAVERKRATTPLVLTMIPGPAATRSMMSALAVTTEVRDGLRRERQVASGVIMAIQSAIDDPDKFTTDKLLSIPALSAIASDDLKNEILTLFSRPGDGDDKDGKANVNA